MEVRRTPLYEEHVRCQGKMVEFGGYCLPVQYQTGVIREHMAVRTACGLFDVSHMGEITLKGKDAVRNLNNLLTNDYTVMNDGQARYSPMCYPNGTTVDDLIVYKVHDDDYFIVVNAANKDKDFAWIRENISGDVIAEDVSDSYAQLALQGPNAQKILEKLTDPENIPQQYYTALFDREVGGMKCIVSRTGYTGEDGFELYLDADKAADMWRLLLETGKDDGLIPCGLGARDTLRLEASMPLYGHELSDAITPIEAGLGFFVKKDKEAFIGKDALIGQGTPARKRVGLEVTGRGIVREHQDVFLDGKKVGITTSGTFCPFLEKAVAMAMIDQEAAKPGTALEVEVRGRRIAVCTVKMPFYKRLHN